MQSYNSKLYPEPDKKDPLKMKEFFNIKYKQRRFAQKEDDDSDESDGSDSEDEKKKKKKKKEEKKKDKKKKHKNQSSDEEEASEENDDAEKAKKKVPSTGKLGAPPSSGKGLKKPPTVETTITAPQVMNFLEMESPQPIKQDKPNTSEVKGEDEWGSWATFGQPITAAPTNAPSWNPFDAAPPVQT